MDYLERRPEHRAFRAALWHLQQMQTDAISAEPLCRRRALG